MLLSCWFCWRFLDALSIAIWKFFSLNFYCDVVVIGVISCVECVRSRYHFSFVLFIWLCACTVFLVQRFQKNDFGPFENFALLTRYVGQLIYRTWWLCYLWSSCMQRMGRHFQFGSWMALSRGYYIRFRFVLLHIGCKVLHEHLLVMMHVLEFVLSYARVKLFVLRIHLDGFARGVDLLAKSWRSIVIFFPWRKRILFWNCWFSVLIIISNLTIFYVWVTNWKSQTSSIW